MKFRLGFYSAGYTLTSADTIGGVTWTRTINSGDDLTFGVAAAAEVKFSILSDALPDGQTLDGAAFWLYISQVESGDDVWGEYGYFYITDVIKNGHKLDITAYDAMYKFEKNIDEWVAGLTYPTTLIDVLRGLCSECGVGFDSNSLRDTYWANTSYTINQNFSATGMTGRILLGYIGEAAGALITIREDLLYVHAIVSTGSEVQIDNTMYRSAKIAEYATPAIDTVQIRVSENDIGVVSGDGSNAWVIENNPLFYTDTAETVKAAADDLLKYVGGITYTPATVELFRDYGIDTGDYYYINGVKSLVMTKTMRPGGVTLTCTGSTKRSQAVSGQSYQLMMLRGRSNVLERSLEETLSRITDAEGNASTALQTAEKIEWIIASGTSSTNFTLTSRMAELISDNISLRGKTIALTADSINITSTYFNVATTGAVDCTSLSVTGDKSSINITGNSSDSGLIKAIYSSNSSFNTVHTPAAFSAYFPYGYSIYGGQYADQLDNSTGYTHVSRFSASEFYVGSSSKINPAIKATVYDSGTDYVLIGGQLSVYGYKNRVEQTAHFGDRLMYTFETPSPLYSDIGRGTVGDDGLCYIDLDPIFYECIDNAYEYFVFLQRESGGDLIVSARYADYFVVSGTPGSRFAWMLIAPQRGASATREEELHVPESEPVSEINQENVAADEMTTAVLNEFESRLY